MTEDIKAQIALIIEAIDDNELQYGRYDNAIKELLKKVMAREEKLVALSRKNLSRLEITRDFIKEEILICNEYQSQKFARITDCIIDAKATLKELGLGE